MRKTIALGSRVWSNASGKYDEMEKHKKGAGFNQLLEKYINEVIQTDLAEELLSFLRENRLHR